ncbi:transcriptional regulator, AraC family [Pelosinus fermentans]|uniref:Transcription activator effector binding protein n=1 Tax=Pelosinus fermentans B4 TaxID=1149862 RepID=I9LER4_9FIRM|nr:MULTISPECIES: helix-turn-helix domain-containing protein [Pelosinus]EIW18954.1 transcription activator effector binding protein [Pelosinus fermentans B4]OAM95314.1 transcriptional regulator with only HTH domain, AraC family [Pelosinus fermentans DSM 17108]SDR26325.1 transcriptional regulator, AraC family [Pelosinus fermentans]
MIDMKETVAACVNYIENNLNEKITLDDIVQHAGISKYHLHRMFKSLTGESLMEYVQSRKLSASVNELLHTNMRMIDIALEYGFDYEQSYIRAFRKKFGHTPLKVRVDNLSLIIKEKLNIHDILSVNNSIIYKPFFIYKPKIYLVGNQHKIVSKSGDKTANSYGNDFYYNYKHKIVNPVNPQVYFGYTDWSRNDEGYIYYIPSLQVHDLSHIPEGMKGITIPAHKYVAFRFVGFFHPNDINGRQVGRLLVHMYSKWIFKSGFKFADTFRFEYIDTAISKDNYCELDIYQPIMENVRNGLS